MEKCDACKEQINVNITKEWFKWVRTSLKSKHSAKKHSSNYQYISCHYNKLWNSYVEEWWAELMDMDTWKLITTKYKPDINTTINGEKRVNRCQKLCCLRRKM